MSEVESTTDQTESNEPLWQVQLASGQVCRMTLELLDDAFQDGLISESSLIMQDGTSQWVTLAQVAGLDSESEGQANGDTASGTAGVPASAIAPAGPVAVAAPAAPAASPEPAPYMDPFAPPLQSGPAAAVPFTAVQAAPFVFPGGASFPPQSYASPEPITRSTAPVAADIEFDLETVNFGKKRSPAKWIIGIAAVLGGVGFAAVNINATTETIPPAVAAPAAPPAYESTPAVQQPTPMTPVVSKPALSDDAKRALRDADKARAAKAQQQRAAQPSRGGGASPGGHKKSDPFHKGGDKYDPLNASL